MRRAIVIGATSAQAASWVSALGTEVTEYPHFDSCDDEAPSAE